MLGFAFGMGWFGVGISWVYVSMHVYGLMPAVLAGAATAAFCAYLAVYPALALGLAHQLVRQRHVAAGARTAGVMDDHRMAARHGVHRLSVACERLCAHRRSIGRLGADARHVRHHADGGVARRCVELVDIADRRRYGWVAAVFVIVIGGGWFGRTQSWTAPAGSPISVRLVQANVPQNLKFEPDGIARAFTTHLALMQGPRGRSRCAA